MLGDAGTGLASRCEVTLRPAWLGKGKESATTVPKREAIWSEMIISHLDFILQGDSGGPLVCDRVVQGIISWGPNNAAPPEVYTKVSRFIAWIKNELAKLKKPLDIPGFFS